MMASRTGFVYHDRFLDHNSGPGHPERPERLKSITTHLKKIKLWHNLQHLMIDSVSEEWLQQVHTHAHIKFVRDSVRLGRKILDQGNTHVGSESYDVALLLLPEVFLRASMRS